jgi:hypothetical protein
MSTTVRSTTGVLEARISKGKEENGLPPNGTFSLWQMLMALLKYANVIQKASAENQAAFAEGLGGKDGIYAMLYQVGCEVGEKDAEGLRDDAYGKFAQAGVSAGSLVATGVKYGVSTRPEINAGEAGIESLKPMENGINNSQAGLKIAEANRMNEKAEIDNRINGWADGSRSVAKFDANDELDQKAARLAANDQTKKAKILKQINKQKTSYQNQISRAEQGLNTFQNLNSTATQGLTNVAAAGGSIAQADAAEAKGRASAAQSMMQANQQAVTQQMDKAAQNAAEALRSALQEAEAFASAAAAQVRG